MTNVRHEHLEFHGTWEQYRDDKANLFRALDVDVHHKSIGGTSIEVPSFGVVCADDPSAAYFADLTSRPVYTYSAQHDSATMYASDANADERGAFFMLHEELDSWPARIELPGAFNIENVLAAVLVVSRLTTMPVDDLVDLLPQLEPVLGRMTRIDRGQPYELIVDYAHTPSSFQTILPSLKERVQGKLICVFGSGGERDIQKRPAQGKIAAEYCGVVILSDEDPRGEDSMALLEDIAAGCAGLERERTLFLIPDRRAAIRKALSIALPGDAVLLLGKGHENTIDYASGAIPWNEIAEARTALGEAGYTR
jgi:UDP-N-acetylmuramoyl-L-alanyl-D-glutamate--2,6-diaminopimelate ligase